MITRISALLSAVLALFAAAAPARAAGPNFIVILADDLGWTCLSQPMDDRMPGAASDYHETPHMDRLARSGMRFTQAYAPDALCCPTRRSLQFGQTPTRQGYERFAAAYDPKAHPRLTIPRLLKSADSRYRTAHYGKWDLRAGIFPEDLGYDESDGNTGNRHGEVASNRESKWSAHFLNEDPKRIETLTDRAISFLRRQQTAGAPFYLQVSHYATHVDMQARETTYARFAAKPRGRIHSHAAWAAMLADLDAGVGRLLAEVDRLGLADTTYVILTADNGAAEFVPPVRNKMDPPSAFPVPPRNHPLRGGKWVLYEGGIRVPFVVRGPGVRPGSRCDVPVAGWDLLPTLADLAGYREPLPADLDGGSIRTLLRDGAGSVSRPLDGLVFHRYAAGYPHSAIRVGDHKLIKLWKTGALELYDLRADPGETTNLAERDPSRTRELHDRMMAYLRRVDAEVLTGYGRAGAEE